MQKYEQLEIELKRLAEKRLTAAEHLIEKDTHYQYALDQFHKEKADIEQLEKQSLSTFVQNLLGSLWSGNYFVSTVGNVSKEVVMQYVQDQLTEFNAGRSRRDSSPG